MKKSHSKTLPIILILCATIVLLIGIGGWIYVQQQQIAQEDRALQQQKQLKEYEQEQLNNRNEKNNITERLKSNASDNNIFTN